MARPIHSGAVPARSSHSSLLSPLQLAHKATDEWNKEFGARSVGPTDTFESALSRFDKPLLDRGRNESNVIADLVRDASPGLTAMNSGRFFGWVIGGNRPVSVAADWLVSSWDQNTCMAEATPAMSAIEEVTRRWVLELLGLPANAGVGFVSGGQMANFVCLLAARNSVMKAHDWDVATEGINGAPNVLIVAGQGKHHTIDRAAQFLGFGSKSIQSVPCDSAGRIELQALQSILDYHTGPMIVCLQAGQINTGAVDDIESICDIVANARSGRTAADIWVHVDGAIGLWARASDRLSPQLNGCEKADSWSTDAHKWLNTPYDCGIAICKDADAYRSALSASASYLSSSEHRSPLDWSPELSRRARATPIYATIRHLGRSGIGKMIEGCCEMAQRLGTRLDQLEGVEVLNDVTLNQVLVRFTDSDGTNISNEVVKAAQLEGTCYLTSSIWDQQPVARFSVCNWKTDECDVDRSVEALRRCHLAISTSTIASP